MNTRDYVVPPCSKWKIWEGPEVEGSTQIGAVTLFVREGIHFPIHVTEHTQRIWFCKEMLDTLSTPAGFRLLEGFRRVRPNITLAFEVPLDTLSCWLPLRKFGAFYIKFDLSGYIKPGDTLCFGAPYNDRFHLVSAAATPVQPYDYSSDKCLEE